MEYVKDLHNKYKIKFSILLMSNEIEINDIKIDIKEKECNCCLTNENLIECPLDKCDYTMCRDCVKKIPGNLCPACRRELICNKIKKIKRRERVYFVCCYQVSRNMAEKLACLRALLFCLGLIIVSRILWFLIFNDRPFFHETWFLSSLGGILIIISAFVALAIFLCIISNLINCWSDCINCCCYDNYQYYPMITFNSFSETLENDICCCLYGCIREEIHIVRREVDVSGNLYDSDSSDYSDDESSLDLE